MRKLIVSEFVSVDGVMEAPGGEQGYQHSGWVMAFPQDPGQTKYKLDEVLDAEALLLGRVTYEGFAAAWPSRTDDAGFADKMNRMPKYVVSTTLGEPEWNNSTVIGDDIAARVAELKTAHDGDILVNGSGQLVRLLVDDGLIDELRLMVFPILLGAGRRLFEDGAAAPLQLVESKPVGSDGVVILTYRPAD